MLITALLITAVIAALFAIAALWQKLKDHEKRLDWHSDVIRRLPPEIRHNPKDLSPAWCELQRQLLASYEDRDPYALIEANRREVEELRHLSRTVPGPDFRQYEPDP